MHVPTVPKSTIRKYGPLAVLYPLSATVGIVTTLYIAHAINTSTTSYNVGKVSNETKTPISDVTSTTISSSSESQLNEVSKLAAEIQLLKKEIKDLNTGNSNAGEQLFPPSTVVAQTPVPPLGNHSATSPSVAPSRAPVVHGSTGASSAHR